MGFPVVSAYNNSNINILLRMEYHIAVSGTSALGLIYLRIEVHHVPREMS